MYNADRSLDNLTNIGITMSPHTIATDQDGKPFMKTGKRGTELLHDPLFNKGSAFPAQERLDLGLNGLLPPHVADMKEQIDRVYENYSIKTSDLEKYIFLRALQDRNETLFYALVKSHVEEMTPIIYTPTVGEAVQKLSHLFRFTRGLWISPENIDLMDSMAKNLPSKDISVIVVTDNQGILGIGDQGAGGMGIPIGKLSLYTLGAGIAPQNCLPISLDVGTDNKALLNDPLYLGHKHKRYTGEKYEKFIEKFVERVSQLWPDAILQWEDFSKQNAFTNLDLFRDKILSFNDDIQGTGAVVTAGILSAMKIKKASAKDQKYLVYGAGAGGIGVARQIRNTLVNSFGLSRESATGLVYVVDSRGLISDYRTGTEEYKLDFSKDKSVLEGWNVKEMEKINLTEVIANAGITVLLGCSGQPHAFDKKVVKAMMKNSSMPVIFPLSNPTSKAEATPEDIYRYSKGRAIVATGSPFGPVEYEGRTFRIGQGNNVFIFPGVGLGVAVAKASRITDEMFSAAAERLADMMPSDAVTSHCVFPRIADLNRVSIQIALAVYDCAVEQGVATATLDEEPISAIKARMWEPLYIPIKPVE